jgi:hypothetical protein
VKVVLPVSGFVLLPQLPLDVLAQPPVNVRVKTVLPALNAIWAGHSAHVLLT